MPLAQWWIYRRGQADFRIVEMIATSGFLAALECTKFVWSLVLPQTP